MKPTTTLSCSEDPPIPVKDHIVVATHDYEMPGKGFLPLLAGDVVYIIEADASGWWLGVNTAGKKGVLPSTYTVPYTFPPPQAVIQRELDLLLLAKRYGADMTNGSPVPLDKLNATRLPPFALSETADLSSVEELYKLVDKAIVRREERRGALVVQLKKLIGDTDTERSAVSGDGSDDQEISAKTALAQKEVSVLRGTLRELVDDALMRKERAPPSGNTLLSPTWYSTVSAALEELGEQALSQTVRELELQDTQRAVRHREDSLARLAEAVKASEETYRSGKIELMQRIERRDAAVTEALAWWAAKAEGAREAYLAKKALLLRCGEVSRQESVDLHSALEKKRQSFHCLATEAEQQRNVAKNISLSLQKQHELEDLDTEVRRLTKEATTLLQKAKREKRHDRHGSPLR